MLGKIIFIGGIHGVGKTSICTDICEQTKLPYLSASELIKWKEITSDAFNKTVVNIPRTQDLLINGLKHATQVGKYYLLDGHYCLLDSTGQIYPIPVETFKIMSPVSLHIILGDVLQIKQRLEARDAKSYEMDLLVRMQEYELLHARDLSTLLGVELSIGTLNDYSEIITSIKAQL